MNVTKKMVFDGIKNAAVPSEVLGWIDKALAEASEPELDRDVLLRVRGYGLERLAELSGDDPVAARQLISGRVLDLCVADPETREERHHYSEYRNSVVRWIEQYGDSDIRYIRSDLLEEISRRLEEKPNSDLVWMVAALGYRDEQICTRLREFALSDCETPFLRDTALSTLCSLGGLSDDDRKLFRRLAEERLGQDMSVPLFNVLRWICSPKSVHFLLQRLSVVPRREQKTLFPNLALTVLSEIAEAHPGELADRVWIGIIDAVSAHETAGERPGISDLILNSGLLKRIDSEKVPEKLLSLLADRQELGHLTRYVRYIIYLRLTELTGIRQLLGFSQPPREEVLRTLEMDCVCNTENSTRNMDRSSWLKESAWDVAFRLGLEEPLSWFGGVTEEINPYMRGRILRLLACFRWATLPDEIGTWIKARVDGTSGDLPEIFYLDPAIRLAGHSADPKALDWLLDLGLTYHGQVPTSGADALSIYCIEKIRFAENQEAERRGIVSQLIDAFQTEWKGRVDRVTQRRMLSAAALESIALAHQLAESEIQEIVKLFMELDFSNDLFALCPLARIVAGASPDDSTLERFEDLAIDDNKWVAGHGVAALDFAGRSSSAKRLLKKHGLTLTDGKWEVTDLAHASELSAYLLGRFYMSDPGSAIDSVIEVVEKGEWLPVSQLLQVLSKSNPSDLPVASAVADALVSRIRTRMSWSYSESNLFSALAGLAPEMLLDTPWHELWTEWSTESRIALIHATAQAAENGTSELQAQAVAILGALDRDKVRDVRQTARLAWAKLHQKSLAESIQRRANPKHSSERDLRLAAEALWAINSEEKCLKAASNLKDYPDRRVREACREALEIRRERFVAEEHFHAVVTGKSDRLSMLGVWKHGSALIETAHSDHLYALRQHLSNPELRPHGRHWIAMLVEKLDKKIKERKRKNIPDWSPPDAQTIGSGGKIMIGNVEREALFVIRKWACEDLGGALDWEGDGWFTGERGHFFSGEKAKIKLDDGSGGTVLVSNSSLDSFSFSGMQWEDANND